MKIKSIREPSYDRYEVTLSPNRIEKFFGVKERVEHYRRIGTYTFGTGGVYVNKQGKELGNRHWIADAIDEYRNSWN